MKNKLLKYIRDKIGVLIILLALGLVYAIIIIPVLFKTIGIWIFEDDSFIEAFQQSWNDFINEW
jgi:hypothetical protein